jgi:hypothetical protein
VTSLVPAIALAVLAASNAADEVVQVTATPSKDEVTLGERFFVDVKATGPAGTSWTFPDQAGNDDVEVRAEPERASAPTSPSPDAHRYQAMAMALDKVSLPPIKVRYRLANGTEGEAATEAVPLRVLSILPKDPSERKLADIRGPLSVSVGAPFWAAVAGLVALLALLVAWLIRRRRAPGIAAPTTASPQAADAEARAALDRLAASNLLTGGEYRAYYIALAEIAKRYLERRLGAPVLEMTSSEMVAFLRDHPDGRALAPAARDVATAADNVKFARGAAVFDEARRDLAGVRGIIDALEARLQPTPVPGEKTA